MIVSKSQSQATLPEERRLTSARLAIASFIIHYIGWQGARALWEHLSEMA
jgi:hypothetical protein